MLTELSINKIKWIRSLHDKKSRDSEGLYLIEGEKMVEEALSTRPELVHTLIELNGVRQPDLAFQGAYYSCTEKQLNQVSTLKTPNKLLAVVRKPLDQTVDLSGLVLALDGIQDPGNLGTIMRIADWFGIRQIICSNDTVDCYNPKVVQASMGAVLRVSINYSDLEDVLSNYTGKIYGAFLEGNSIYKEQLNQTGIIVLGNEGNGIRKEVSHFITDKIHIPSFGGAESLNVSVAAGIIVSEFKRRSN
jgi:RNA methyltransferase, TrmH family